MIFELANFNTFSHLKGVACSLGFTGGTIRKFQNGFFEG